MTLIEKAIRAAMAADMHFALNRRPQLSTRCLGFIDAFPDANAEALYIYAHQEPAWREAKGETRSAWEIFRATALILRRAETSERLRSQPKPRAQLAPAWMRDADEEEAPEVSDRVVMLPPAPRPALPAPTPDPAPSQERKRPAKSKALVALVALKEQGGA